MNFIIQELRDEIEADPAGLGYKEADGITWKGDVAISTLLNDPAFGASIFRTNIPMSDVYAVVDWLEIVQRLTDVKREVWRQITSTAELDADSPNIQNALSLLFPASGPESAPNTRTTLLALIQRQGSRAEVLWGDGANVAHLDVAQARNL